jgi:small-conductance mechanosensitive channel
MPAAVSPVENQRVTVWGTRVLLMDLLPPYQWIEQAFGLPSDTQHRIVRSLVVILLLWAIHRLVVALSLRQVDDLGLRYRLKKSATYVTVIIGALLVGRIWFVGVQSVATFLGLLSAGLAIALRDLVASFAGWIFIVWRRPFEVGDRVQVGEHAGDVIDIRVFQFTLLEIRNWVDADQPTGRIVHIPNSRLFTEPQMNYSRGTRYIWNELPVLVTFESNWEAAKRILEEIVDRHSVHGGETVKRELLRASTRFRLPQIDFEPRVFTSVEDSGVLLTARYLCEPRRRRGSAEAVWEDILRAFAERDDIDFAYPTIRHYHNPVEGKPNTRAEPSPSTGHYRPL